MHRTSVLAAFVLALLMSTCWGTGYEETTYDGVDFTLTCEPVEPDLVGSALGSRTNASQVTASRDTISLDPRRSVRLPSVHRLRERVRLRRRLVPRGERPDERPPTSRDQRTCRPVPLTGRR